MSRPIGIDFGTANCVVCALEGGEPTVIPTATGARVTPTVVAFTRQGEVLVGEPARRQAITNPHRTVRSVKRRMDEHRSLEVDGRAYGPQDIAALVFAKLKRDAEEYLGETVTDAVVAVPASILQEQRYAIQHAAALAGLNVLRLIYEPTAAALAYGLDRPANEQTVLVFDLGGGTFDVSVLELGEGVFEVKATAGDGRLGGDDWDDRIADRLARQVQERHGVDLSGDEEAAYRLKEAAERAKIELSAATTTSVSLPYLAHGPDGPVHLEAALSRAEFQRSTSDLLDRCRGPFEQALKDAGIKTTDLDHVILVGGATRMPAVVDLVRELTGKEPNRSVNPDEVVARGAALQAGVLKGEVRDILLLDVTPLSLGIETKGGIMQKLIERNTTIPTKRSDVYTTERDNQSAVLVQVFQGEREMAAYNRYLGRVELPGIPPAPEGVPQIEVTFEIDANGATQVSAKDLGTGATRSVRLTAETMRDAPAPTRGRMLVPRRVPPIIELPLPVLTRAARGRGKPVNHLPTETAEPTGELTLEVLEAAKGAVVTVTVDGKPLTIAIPAGVRDGSLLVYPRKDGGNVSVRIAVAVPPPIFDTKVVLAGEGTVGKTSLVAALRGEPFQARPRTHGIEISDLELRHPETGAALTVRFWDFGGQPVYRTTHQFFYSSHALYLVVWNARAGHEKDDVRGWLDRIHLRLGDAARVLLVATHGDEARPDLDYDALRRDFPEMLAGLYTVDNRSGRGIVELRDAILREAAARHLTDVLQPHWINARDEVLARRASQPQISYQEFAAVCGRHAMTADETETLAGLLHRLGQIIYQSDDEALREVVILDPEWLSKAIGRVLEDPATVAAGGVLDHARLAEIWRDRWHHAYFLRLMERFDVSYRLEDGRHSLIAQLVPGTRPALPWDARSLVPPDLRRLALVWRLTAPVTGLVSALTVRLSYARTGLHWRDGVFLRHPNDSYASEALIELRGGTSLVMEVRAPSPDLFFHVIRDSVEHLVRRWPALRFEQLVPCPNRCPGQFRLDRLMERREQRAGTVMCQECFGTFDVGELLTGFPSARAAEPAGQVNLDERLRNLELGLLGIGEGIRGLQASAADNAYAMRRLLAVAGTEIVDCPRLFTVSRVKATGLAIAKPHQTRYRLVLWCEHSGAWHPCEGGEYLFERPAQWFQTISGYAAPVLSVLAKAISLAGAFAGVTLSGPALEKAKAELELMRTLVAEMPVAAPDDAAWTIDAGPPLLSGPDLRGARYLLRQLDPQSRYGGLHRVQAPSGEFLWVCPDHATAYDPGLPSIVGQ